MLPAQHRLRESADFTAVLRGAGGVRSGTRLLVVHAHRTDSRGNLPPRVGFVVSKQVGGSVIRNRTKRRLRAQVGMRMAQLSDGFDYVVRAQPASAGASSAELGADLDRVLASITAKVGK